MLRRVVLDHYQRETGGHLRVVAIGGAGREPIELLAGDGIRVAMSNRARPPVMLGLQALFGLPWEV